MRNVGEAYKVYPNRVINFVFALVSIGFCVGSVFAIRVDFYFKSQSQLVFELIMALSLSYFSVMGFFSSCEKYFERSQC